MSLNKYFEDVNEFANQNFHSFDGNFEFADEDFGFDYESDGYSADGGGMANAAPTSQPYIINVQNTTASAIANVTILGAYTFIGTSSPAYGNTAGISISMGISNVTYTEFLYQSMNKPFSVGLTYTSSQAVPAQVLETITVTQKDINGNISSKVLTPTIDPYQFQTDKIAFKFEYRIDGFTNLTISQVLANATMKIYFYPSETVSVSRALAGRAAVQDYGKPSVVRTPKIQLGGRPSRPRQIGR